MKFISPIRRLPILYLQTEWNDRLPSPYLLPIYEYILFALDAV